MQLHADVVLWPVALCGTRFQAGGGTRRSPRKCSRLGSAYSPDLTYLISFVSVAAIEASVALLGSRFHCTITPTTVQNVFSSNVNVLYLIQTWPFLQRSCSETHEMTAGFLFSSLSLLSTFCQGGPFVLFVFWLCDEWTMVMPGGDQEPWRKSNGEVDVETLEARWVWQWVLVIMGGLLLDKKKSAYILRA